MTDALEEFEAERERLFAIAYRMLGSAAAAEDVLQEAYLRWRDAPRAAIESKPAYLSTIVTRMCLDELKSARVQRETYVGPWLPEPLPTHDPVDPASISLAFLVLLESLSPLERAAYLLHEVFEYSHAEVAGMLDRDEAACRQLLHRAKQHVLARRPRFAPSKLAHRRLLDRFIATCQSGDLEGLHELLAEDVRMFSDGGGKAFAARKPVLGRERIANFYLALFRKAPATTRVAIEEVNGLPAMLLYLGDTLFSVINLETDGTKVYAIRSVLNPDKLSGLRRMS